MTSESIKCPICDGYIYIQHASGTATDPTDGKKITVCVDCDEAQDESDSKIVVLKVKSNGALEKAIYLANKNNWKNDDN